MSSSKDSKPVKRKDNGARSYAKYSGIAIQMVVILLLGTYAGQWLDANYGVSDKPYLTIVAVLISIGLALYLPLRSLLR